MRYWVILNPALTLKSASPPSTRPAEHQEIQASFDALQEELSVEIDENMRTARRKLLENFDAEVAEKLSVYKETTTRSLSRYEALLWDTTKHILAGSALFDEENLAFRLHRPPLQGIPSGLYTLKHQDSAGHHYRLASPCPVGAPEGLRHGNTSGGAVFQIFRQRPQDYHPGAAGRQKRFPGCKPTDCKGPGV